MIAFSGKFPLPEVGTYFKRGTITFVEVQNLLSLLPRRTNGDDDIWFCVFARVYGWSPEDISEMVNRIEWHTANSLYGHLYKPCQLKKKLQELGLSPLSHIRKMSGMFHRERHVCVVWGNKTPSSEVFFQSWFLISRQEKKTRRMKT
jgi:hypothetical protein